MEKRFISTKKCNSCGADIAVHFQRCPYCENILPTDDLLPKETYKTVEEKLLSIEKALWRLKFDRQSDFIYYFAIFRILLIPLFAALITYFLFSNWIPAILIIVPTGLLSYIRMKTAYQYYYMSYKQEKELWQKIYRTELNDLMKEYDAPVSAYQDIVLDIMERDEYGEFSPLLVLMDPVDE